MGEFLEERIVWRCLVKVWMSSGGAVRACGRSSLAPVVVEVTMGRLNWEASRATSPNGSESEGRQRASEMERR